MIGAAVDVGSNSVHLLVARVGETGVESILDVSEQLGLGDVVDTRSDIPEDAQLALIHSLATYRDLAHSEGAESVTFLGTEPLRRATNGAEVAARVTVETGVPFHVITHREEGELTFLGVTGGRPIHGSLLVVDVGGGSTEIVTHEPARGLNVTALPTGSNRLSNELVSHDPPTAAEVRKLRDVAAKLVAQLPAARLERAVFVGGTATNVVRLGPINMGAFDDIFAVLTAAPAAEISARFGVRLRRARQLAAGAALTEALIRHYGVVAAEVSDASLRDGAILAAAGAALPPRGRT